MLRSVCYHRLYWIVIVECALLLPTLLFPAVSALQLQVVPQLILRHVPATASPIRAVTASAVLFCVSAGWFGRAALFSQLAEAYE